jgi:FtsZ-binding cell division protein ZapB
MTDVLWVIVGIIIGSFSGILTISLLTAGKTEDLYTEISNLSNEVQDLRTQRELLKQEIGRLNKPRRKPTPRKKRNYKPRNTRKKK